MGKKTMLLGYTRSGHAVLLPVHATTDMSEFVSWTPGDHIDASRILREHGERAGDPHGAWCAQLADVHRTIGKRTKKRKKKNRKVGIRGAAEATILAGRRR